MSWYSRAHVCVRVFLVSKRQIVVFWAEDDGYVVEVKLRASNLPYSM